MKLYRNYIGGAWRDSAATQRVPNVNPSDSADLIGSVPLALPSELASAVEAADRAFPDWRRTPAPERGAIVARAARLLDERAETIARALVREEGKTLADARDELRQAIAAVEFCGALGRRLAGETLALEQRNRFGYTLRRPLGPVALITSWDEPAAGPATKIAAALVTGNTAILKPATLAPETATLVVASFADAGTPPGVLNMVYGAGGEAGAALVAHPAVRAISFTGSAAVGAEIYRRAAARGVRAYCETGGRNPVVVLDDADLDLAVAGVATGAFGAAGQRHTATSHVILMHPVADAFLEQLVARALALRIGPGDASGVELGPLADESRLRRVLGCVEAAVAEGAELLCGGTRATESNLARGFFMRPTVVDRVRPDMQIASTEVFGPVLAVTRVDSFDDALAAVRQAGPARSAALYTHDSERIFRFVDEVDAGAVRVNVPALGGEAQLATGGSDAGEPGSPLLDFYSELRAVYIAYGAG